MSEGKAYSAGTIFLQVVPVFKDVMRDTQAYAQKQSDALGDQMERGGRDAGKRASKAMNEELVKGSSDAGDKAGEKYAGNFQNQLRKTVKDAQREIDSINFDTASENTIKDLDRVKSKLRELSKEKYDVNVDTKRATNDVQHLEALVKKLVTGDHDLHIEANLQKVLSDLEMVGKTADKVAAKKREIRFESNIDTLEREMGRFEQKMRASAKSAASALGDQLSPRIKQIKRELEGLSNADVGIDISTDAARAKLAELSRELRDFAKDETLEVDVRADTGSAYADLVAFNAFGTEIDGKHWDVTVGLDAKGAVAEMGAFERKVRDVANSTQKSLGDVSPSLNRIKGELADIANPQITPDLNDERVIAEMRGLAGELRALATDTKLKVDVRTNAAAAYAELVPLMAAFSAIDGRKLNVEVDLDAGAAIAEAGLLAGIFSKLRGGGEDATNAFRSFNGILLAGLVLIPALVPAIAALGGGLLALIPILGAVGAGLGVMLAGFSGIAPVIKGFSDVQKNAGQDALVAGKRMTSAARSVEDAERSLARARQSAAQANADAARSVARAQEQAARQIKNALESQQEAEHNLANAQRDATDAQLNLIKARKDAQKELEDAANKRAENALAIRQGVVDVFNATTSYNATMNDGSSTNLDKENASIQLAQAQLALKENREEGAKLAEEKKQQDKTGVDGTNTVKTAQNQLTDALERQHDAQLAVAKAAEAVKEAQLDGIRSVQDAQRAQSRAAVAGAQSVADAQRGLTQAQEDYDTALSETSTSARNLQQALDNVGPAGERFARFIYGLKAQALDLRNAIQEAMLPGVQAGLETIINTYGPQFKVFAADMGGVIGHLFQQAGQGLGAKPWQDFFSTYAKLAPRLLEGFGKTTGNWMSVFARLLTIAAPYAERLNDALLAMSNSALDFVNSAKGTKFWTDFLDYAFKVGPSVVDFFWDLWGALVAIAKAMAPWGTTVLKGLDGLLNWIQNMDPNQLSFLVTTLIGIGLALQALAGVLSLYNAGRLLVGSPWRIFAFLVVTLSIALYSAYQNSKTFRDAINGIIGFLRAHAKTIAIFSAVIGTLVGILGFYALAMWAVSAAQTAYLVALLRMDAIKAFISSMKILTGSIWAQNAAWLANPITWIILGIIALIAIFVLLYKHNERVRDITNQVWKAIKDGANAVWKVIQPVLKGIANLLIWVWEHVWKPYLTFVYEFWVTIFKAMAWVWNTILMPVFTAIVWAFQNFMWPIIDLYLKLLIGLWTYIFKAMAWTWNNILWPIISLFIHAIVALLWNAAAKPIFKAIHDAWNAMATGMKWVYEHVLKPVFDWFADHILPHLRNAFQTAVDGIATLWNTLREIVTAPIRFVIDKVINHGLIAAFNWVANKVGSKPMGLIPIPGWMSDTNPAPKAHSSGGGAGGGSGSKALATGGVLPGYTPGRDVHDFYSPTGGRLSLSGGEAIMRPEFTQAVGGAEAIDYWNRIARSEGIGGVRRRMGGRQAYAKGGVFWPVPGHQVSTYPGHDGIDINRGSGWDDYGDPIRAFRDGVITYVGTGHGYGEAIFEHSGLYGTVVYGHTSKQYVHAGQLVKGGDLIGRVGSTGHSSAPHLHFGHPGGTSAQALALLQGALNIGGGDVGGGISMPGWASKILEAPVKWLEGKVEDKFDSFTKKFGDNPITEAIVGVSKKLVGGMAEKIKEMTESARSLWSVSPLGALVGALTGGDSKIKDEVKAVAARYGWDRGAEWNAIDYIVSHESSWDPNAVNGNAMGLFQKMTSVNGPVEHTVTGQAKWGMNYIKDRYGDPLGAKRYWDSHQAYADGGVYEGAGSGAVADNGTMMYDNGGYLPPGLTTVLNLTGKPEPVFTDEQFRSGSAGGGSGVHYEPHFHQTDLTSKDVAFDLDVEFRRMGRRAGRYAGSS